MLPDRVLLDQIDPADLEGKVAIITWNQDKRAYTLRSQIGKGQTAVAWHVEDSMGRAYALKLVPRTEFATHSLDAEARLSDRLDHTRFAKIEFYGAISVDGASIDLNAFYGVVVSWIEGVTLHDYLRNTVTSIDGRSLCRLTRELCEVLQELRTSSPPLTHNDLHDKNILVHDHRDPLTHEKSNRLAVIDTGQLKSIARRDALLERWRDQCSTLEQASRNPGIDLSVDIQQLKDRISWFQRTDQEWVVCHLCSLFNKMLSAISVLSPADKRFVRDLPELLSRMIDPDHSRRLDDPGRMYSEVESLWSRSSEPGPPKMATPFDLPSAELIRSDRQLMNLFSEEYPRIDACRSNGPVYIYGPRGSGKSTILRSLSIKALLAAENPKEELDKIPFFGVYLSSSQELRSRFWLMTDADFTALEGHVVRYFNLLLLEALADSLNVVYGIMHGSDLVEGLGEFNSLSQSVANNCVSCIRKRAGLDESAAVYAGSSAFATLKRDIQRSRDDLWLRILRKEEPELRPDAQLVFDVVRDIEQSWPVLSHRRIAFLIDDYSNQRIPRGLQRKLNQAITFSKQGSPIFKVTSEYDGVDLEGVQEGREVSEVNVGFEYVSLAEANRYRFLQNVLEKRFEYCDCPVNLLDVLPLSGIGPSIPMATAIRAAFQEKKRFYYHGLDTISDFCSGDFAMGIDVVRRIFEHSGVNWKAPRAIPAQKQDEAIREYTKQEYEYIRHQSQLGRQKYDIADKLSWLSKECVLRKETKKDGKAVPLIKNHLDVRETALRELELQYKDNAVLLSELVRSGILFPLQPSRAVEGHDATRRYMLRRILLARYSAPLGRHRPILINDVQRLVWLLTDPSTFVEDELGIATVEEVGTLGEEVTGGTDSEKVRDRQLRLFQD